MNITIVVFAVILSLGAIEIVLSIHNPFFLNLRGNKITLPIYQKSVRVNPYATKLDKRVIVSRNSLGFWGEEPPINIDEFLSVVAIGGSTTECSALTNGKDWPALLNASLQSKFSKLWLNNAGFGGHSTFGHLYLQREYVSSISPKVILYLVGINDVLRSSQNPGTTLPNNKHPYLLRPSCR